MRSSIVEPMRLREISSWLVTPRHIVSANWGAKGLNPRGRRCPRFSPRPLIAWFRRRVVPSFSTVIPATCFAPGLARRALLPGGMTSMPAHRFDEDGPFEHRLHLAQLEYGP